MYHNIIQNTEHVFHVLIFYLHTTIWKILKNIFRIIYVYMSHNVKVEL